MEFEIVDEVDIPTLGDLLPRPASKEPTQQEILAAREALNAAGLAIPATMGIFEGMGALLQRLFFRKFLRALDEQTEELVWLECHVPPDANYTFCYEESSTAERSIELSVFGLDIGAGKTVTLARKHVAEPRSFCVAYFLKLIVRPMVYEVSGRESIELDVLGGTARGSKRIVDCPHCGITAGDIDRFDYQCGTALDRREDDVTTTETFTVELSRSLSLNAAVSVPGIEFPLSIGGSITEDTALELAYEFPPGRCYVPYWRSSDGAAQTPMWAIDPK